MSVAFVSYLRLAIRQAVDRPMACRLGVMVNIDRLMREPKKRRRPETLGETSGVGIGQTAD